MEIAKESELEKLLNKKGIEYLDAIFTDLCGYVRGKRFPLNEASKIFKDGFQLPYSVFYLDALGGVTNNLELGWADGDPDGLFFPITNTIKKVPWNDNTLQILVSMCDEEKNPSILDPRNMLASILKKFDAINLKPVVAFELEFYLLDKNKDNLGKPLPATGVDKTNVYGMRELDIFKKLLEDINENCKIQNIPASTFTSEFAPTQYEINLSHTSDLLKAADDASLLRRVIHETTLKHGYEATFMAKPFLEQTGSGMHIHMSMYDDKNNNLFSSGDNLGTDLLKNAIAGMQSTLYDSFPIFIPNRNGFRRIKPDQFVPVNKSWGYNNRTVALRIPSGKDEARRIEHRVASADANAYLTLASILAGVLNGINNKLQPTHFIEYGTNAGIETQADPEIPTSLENSLIRFENSKILKEYFGENYLKLYASVKRGEENLYNSAFIPKEEYDYYL